MSVTRRARWLVCLLAVLAVLSARPAWADATQDAIAVMLRSANARGCQTQGTVPQADGLDRILCRGVMAVGVRGRYPGFGVADKDGFKGYDVDVGQAIARRLGVRMVPDEVTPANRIALVSRGEVDLVIATMGHSMTRDSQITFIRPHYYASRTSVIGAAHLDLPNIEAIAGRTVCVPLGNASSIVLARERARLMIFEQPQHLLDALRFDRCALVAHDDSFFAASLADPAFAARFEEKFAFFPFQWGIGVARTNTAELARLLGLIVTDMHRTGALIALAETNSISRQFLIEQRKHWSNPACILASGDPAPGCMLGPVMDIDAPTRFADTVAAAEAWLLDRLGIKVVLPMLKGQQALALFEEGIVNTLILVFGAIAATVGFALLLRLGLNPRFPLMAVAMRWLIMLLQSSPVVLLLVLGYFLATSVLAYGAGVALATAIVVIGLCNGGFAASALADAALTLTAETGQAHPPFAAVLSRSATQITGFAVNAARASAVASFIGTPELLTALTDIAAVTTERRTTFAILLLFYLAVVMLVMGLAGGINRWLTRRGAVA